MKQKNKKPFEKSDEDVSFDLSWLKKLFSKKNKNSEKKEFEKEEKEEDLSLNFKGIYSNLSKYFVFFLILIPLLLSVYIRTIPDEMPIAQQWARNGIYNNIRSNIASQISQQYPNLPEENMNALIEQQLNTFLGQQSQAIEEAVIQQAEILKEQFKDEKGNMYLGDIDSYYWLRYARNIVEKGHIEDEIREGVLIDNHMTAPNGFIVDVNIYPYLIAYLYKFLSFFNSEITLMKASFYTPLFLSFIAIIAAFLIGKKLSGNLAGLIAAILIAVNPTILSRSLGSDNDIVNAVFPLLIMLFTIYAFDTKNIKQKIVFALFAGIFIGVYSFAWSGWWFLFLFIIGATCIYAGYLLFFDFWNNRKDIKKILNNKTLINIVIFLVVFLIASYISLAIFGKEDLFFKSFFNPLKIVSIKDASRGASIWPNVYTTVAELNEADFGQIISSLGGALFLWIGLMGSIISLTMLEKKEKKTSLFNWMYLSFSALYFALVVYIATAQSISILILLILISLPLIIGLVLSVLIRHEVDPIHSILLTIWFIATIYASTKGIRFILLIVPTFAVSFSVFFGELAEKLSRFISNSLDINKNISKFILIVFSLALLLTPIQQGYATAYNYIPSVNDAWVDSLTKIKQESSQDAIINSWWDFGHWFKYFGDRGVTFDGASQNSAQAHWMGKILLTDNEEHAIAILRMMDCNSNNAFSLIDEELNDTHDSIKVLYLLLPLNRKDAEKELLKITDKEKTEKILDSLYCIPPENYFITSQDMVGKAPVWAHFGIWDFERANIYMYYKFYNYEGFVSNLMKEYNYSEDAAKRTYYELSSLTDDREINNWIAPWPSYMGSVSCIENTNKTLQCNIPTSNTQSIPLQINLITKEAFITATQGTYYPSAFGFADGKNYKVINYNNNTIGYGISLLQDNRTLVLMSEDLVGSMFTRLFYYDGLGLKYFNQFNDVRDISGQRIITWKIDWPEMS